jgi:predicted RNA-binding Zn ribbon-like protein
MEFDSDGPDVGLQVAVELANALATREPAAPEEELRRILAVDPPSAASLGSSHVAPMVELAGHIEAVGRLLLADDVDGAALEVNGLLQRHSAHPHLAREGGRWRLHHHPADAELVPMWTAICADALARLIDAGRQSRLGQCGAEDCTRLHVDTSRNGSRRFCSTTCQNRVKSAAYRRRRRAPQPGLSGS